MREVVPEPASQPPQDGASGRVLVAVIVIVLAVAAVAAWKERSQKQKAREARYYVVNGSKRLKSGWARLQIGQSAQEVESLLGQPSKKHPGCWYYATHIKDYVDESPDDPHVYFDVNMRVRGWVPPP